MPGRGVPRAASVAVLALWLAGPGLAAAPAQAARISESFEEAAPDCGECTGSLTLVYRADRGERNDVSVTVDSVTYSDGVSDAPIVRIADRGAQIADPPARLECRRMPDRSLACPVFLLDYVQVETGDGDDRVKVDSVSAIVDGGDGRDQIRTGTGEDHVDGGRGTDRVRTGSGRDVLSDAGGSGDLLDAGSPARPTFLGDDADTLDLSSRRRGVRVDLRTQTLTSPGERDRLRSIENVVPGRGDDTVVGNAGINILEEALGVVDVGLVGERLRDSGDDLLVGGGGRDGIASLGGNDELVGNAGNDQLECNSEHFQRCRLAGGPGNDLLNGTEGPDRLDGGPGRDRLYSYEGDDVISAFDGSRDRLDAGRGFDRARVDPGLDRVAGVERRLP